MKKAVITGIGVVSPIGINLQDFYNSLLKGEAIFTPEENGYNGHGNGQLSSRISAQDHKKMIEELSDSNIYDGEGTRFGVYAALQAIHDSNLILNENTMGPIPIYIGNSEGEASILSRALEDDKETTFGFESDAIPRQISSRLGLSGPVITFHNTCASANMALEAAVRDIKHERCQVALCGASDPFSIKILAGFNSLKALGINGCKPFASDRKGIVISEGAFVFVVEEAEHAKARGARIYAEILSVGISNDASHLTNPDPNGIKLAIVRALNQANIAPSMISMVFAHGTGTLANDKTESSVLTEIFNESKPAVCAIKSTVGHMMAAAGAANIAAACLSFYYGQIPPSKRSEPLDPSIDINVVTNVPTATTGEFALVNAFGFGGNNAVAILRAYPK